MPSICFYFQVHQPYRVKKYSFFDIGKDMDYFNDDSETDLNNKKILKKVARKSYLPANQLLLKLLKKHPDFKVSFSFSGVFLEQLEQDLPLVLKSFQDLVDTGRVEILSETYYHSLSFLFSREEFLRQTEKHQLKIKELFGVKPRVFRNTELIFNNDLAGFVEDMGYEGILAEGADKNLGWRSPNFVYKPKNGKKIKLLLKNYRLSDDIAFRFSDRGWKDYPLTAEKFARWINRHNGNGEIVNLFMDYETFGEHQWEDTGIFKFMEKLPEKIFENKDNGFLTPSEAVKNLQARDEVDFPDFVSWADQERDLSAWKSNSMQEEALNKVYSLESEILETHDSELIENWRRLQISDHFYYMCTKWFEDGNVHKYFNPYESPFEAFISFMNALNDLKLRVEEKKFLNKNKKIKIKSKI
ncbi:MAG: glycoside hydrolase family 57 protein [Candidatus Moraniibacteriota bacterium]